MTGVQTCALPISWGAEHRAALGMPFAFSAHNQFLQSMSAAGTLGLLSLLAYLMILAYRCKVCADATNGVSMALFVIVFLRCMTETPFAPGAIFNGDMIAHLIIFKLALGQPAGIPTRRKSWPIFQRPSIYRRQHKRFILEQ